MRKGLRRKQQRQYVPIMVTRLLNPTMKDFRFWTNHEVRVLQEHYPEGGSAAVARLLKGKRTVRGIKQKAASMGITSSYRHRKGR